MDKRKLAALAVKAVAGDGEAFEALYVEHARSILFHVRSLIVDKENYSDVAQEVVLEMLQHIGQLREPLAFRGWMHQIIRSTCASHNRGLMKDEKYLSGVRDDETLESVQDDDSLSNPEEFTMASLEGNKLFSIVSRLPAAYREIIVLRYYDDLSYKEIAEAQGISVSNVSTRLQRAMIAIRKELLSGNVSGFPEASRVNTEKENEKLRQRR